MPTIEINRNRETGTFTIVPSKLKGVSCMAGKNIVVPINEWLVAGHRIIHDVLTAAALSHDGEPSEFYNEWSASDRKLFFNKNVWAVAHYKRAAPRQLRIEREGGATIDFDDYLRDDFGAKVNAFLNMRRDT